MPKFQYLTLIALTVTVLSSTSAKAEVWDVVYGDGVAGGLDWTGVVDSSTDTLTINSWSGGAHGVLNYWNVGGSDLPLVFNSITGAAGSESSFDVPDDWDGTFNNWGFLSASAVSGIDWVEGSGAALNAHLGWGVNDTRSTNTPALTYSNDTGAFFNIPVFPLQTINSFSAPAEITVAPEPSSILLLSLGFIGVLLSRKR